MLGLPPAGERSRCSMRTTRRATGSAAISSIWRRSNCRPSRARRTRRGDTRGGLHISYHWRSRSSRSREAVGVDLRWYVGLDAEATGIGNALWNGEELGPAMHERVVGLYRLKMCDDAFVVDAVRGNPAYLILAMTPDRYAADEAAEPHHRTANCAARGRVVTGAPENARLTRPFRRRLLSGWWSSGARRKATGSISPGGRCRCFPGIPRGVALDAVVAG